MKENKHSFTKGIISGMIIGGIIIFFHESKPNRIEKSGPIKINNVISTSSSTIKAGLTPKEKEAIKSELNATITEKK